MVEESNEPVELYKRFRPKRWEELIGQEKVAKSLSGVIRKGKVPTAYILSGPRGTGKTSTALLIAKSINCLNPLDDGNPCNECEVCINIDNGTQLGVNYISMANKGSVDDIREIVREAELNQPINRAIFILDEAHNLSKSAFDSLLIPLEKRDMPALFLLCTTEIHKIPDTISSRVQSRKLNLVPMNKMTVYLHKLRDDNNLSYTDEDIALAVRQGRGSVRDTLSALDTILAMGDVEEGTYGYSMIKAIAKRDLGLVYTLTAQANNDNINFREFGEQLFEDLRDLMLINAGVSRELVNIPEDPHEDKIIKMYHGRQGLSLMMNEIGDALTQMSQGMDSKIRLEIAILKGIHSLNKLTKIVQAQQ